MSPVGSYPSSESNNLLLSLWMSMLGARVSLLFVIDPRRSSITGKRGRISSRWSDSSSQRSRVGIWTLRKTGEYLYEHNCCFTLCRRSHTSLPKVASSTPAYNLLCQHSSQLIVVGCTLFPFFKIRVLLSNSSTNDPPNDAICCEAYFIYVFKVMNCSQAVNIF